LDSKDLVLSGLGHVVGKIHVNNAAGVHSKITTEYQNNCLLFLGGRGAGSGGKQPTFGSGWAKILKEELSS